MANALKAKGYQEVIPFKWEGTSILPVPGQATGAGHDLAKQVLTLVTTLSGPVNLHFIGHSRGAVVISQALTDLLPEEGRPQLRDGLVRMTMLDPHPAHNHPNLERFYSRAKSLWGLLAEGLVIGFQYAAQDPEVAVPGNVDLAEAYYQHTNYNELAGVERTLNLWGEPVAASFGCDVTTPGTGHSEVHDRYLELIEREFSRGPVRVCPFPSRPAAPFLFEPLVSNVIAVAPAISSRRSESQSTLRGDVRYPRSVLDSMNGRSDTMTAPVGQGRSPAHAAPSAPGHVSTGPSFESTRRPSTELVDLLFEGSLSELLEVD